MYNNLENIASTIDNLSKKDWKKLFDLIPRIEQTKHFTLEKGLEKDPVSGDIIIKPISEKKIVRELVYILDELNLLIDFNWVDWKEGREIDVGKDFENQDTITLLKLISAYIRNDRYCDGLLASKFENRSIEKILKQIKKNIENNSNTQ